MEISDILKKAESIKKEIGKVIIGKDSTIELILASVLCSGHVLLEDLPGSGKTTLIKTLSLALGCSRSRIQFTPDLLPSDVVGTSIFDPKEGNFRHVIGPVNTNLLLADEINRAIPRTQSALLEAMEERQVTIDGVSYPLPQPFFVMATQNPVEKESTFPLPAAQMDRFFIKTSMGYPTVEEELQMLDSVGNDIPFDTVNAVTNPEEIRQMSILVRDVHLERSLEEYIVQIVQKTRQHKALLVGASPRASKNLYQGSRALAALRGRDFVIPKDIQDLLSPVLEHRLTLTGEARYHGNTEVGILKEIIEDTPVPPVKEKLFSR